MIKPKTSVMMDINKNGTANARTEREGLYSPLLQIVYKNDIM